MPSKIIHPIHTGSAQLESVGGKGVNLTRLAQAGLPVPNGFLITTAAYQEYVKTNRLKGQISTIIDRIPFNDPKTLKAASQEIRYRFTAGEIPSGLANEITQAYQSLQNGKVAVRSSATAEDLPDMSFAGQQDTYLNMREETQVLKAIVDCWSSLWTARAIGYRARNGIPQEGVSLSVVVQEMIQSESSGVLFTANPLTGTRTETVIDATLGLGEALVGGYVEPDHYIVDTRFLRITQKTLGEKAVMVKSSEAGGVIFERINAQEQQALPDKQILELAELGQKVARIYKFPQDIEWAWANGALYLLQSRPITSLFPLPEQVPQEPLQVYFSFAAVQGVFDPITPLGQDAIRLIFAGGASLFGLKRTHETQEIIISAGERLWGNITTVVQNPIGGKIILGFLSGIDQGVVKALKQLQLDKRVKWRQGRFRLSSLRNFLRFLLPTQRRILKIWLAPETQADKIHAASAEYIAQLQSYADSNPDNLTPLQHQVKLFRKIDQGFYYAIPHIATGAIGGLLPLFMLNRLAVHLTGSRDLALEITRGMPNNVTTEMDLRLWDCSQAIKTKPEIKEYFSNRTSEELAEEYLNEQLPPQLKFIIQSFLEKYGMRGLGEIDIGRPRWRENPTHIIQVLQSYLKIEDETMSPAAVFERGIVSARAAAKKLEGLARAKPGGRLRAGIVRWAVKRARALSGMRETPKFHIVQMMGIIRQEFLKTGKELVKTEVLAQQDDLFFLTLNELEAMANGEQRNWKTIIQNRRETQNREAMRKQLPRLMLSDGRAFYEGIEAINQGDGYLQGSPVSPGVVEGTVRVVFDPQNANLLPGEIMVCLGTDPAWTPLFLVASGLIMEVGGMMTHGAIVAREYGIPAVVAVHKATERLQTGQRIRVDGSTGQIISIE